MSQSGPQTPKRLQIPLIGHKTSQTAPKSHRTSPKPLKNPPKSHRTDPQIPLQVPKLPPNHPQNHTEPPPIIPPPFPSPAALESLHLHSQRSWKEITASVRPQNAAESPQCHPKTPPGPPQTVLLNAVSSFPPAGTSGFCLSSGSAAGGVVRHVGDSSSGAQPSITPKLTSNRP